MAHQWMRVNLAATSFPFATELWGRSVIVPQYDENYERVTVSNADISKDKGVPQAFYMHNVMPTAQGYQAIGYDLLVSPLVGHTDFDVAFPIQNASLNHFMFVPADGANYIFDAEVGHWASVSPIIPGILPANILVTTAFVQGQTYICYAGHDIYKYNETTKVLDSVAFTGITKSAIQGICAANGYLIAWDSNNVIYYSNTAVPTDFVPSLITGAGSTTPGDAKGKIVVCLPISGGFIIYCEKNCVGATYSGNINFPFVMIEIPGSGGISDPEQVSWQANLSYHYIWSSVGLQQLALKGDAQNVFPELTDFLAGLLFEDYDEATKNFSVTYLTQPLRTRISVVEDGYLIVSYGIVGPPDGQFTHAIIMDLNLQRWGKIKFSHVDAFQWNTPNFYLPSTWGQLDPNTWGSLIPQTWADLSMPQDPLELPRKTVSFLQQDGTVKALSFALGESNRSGEVANGVLVLGKYQMQRNKFIQHQQIDVENVISGEGFDVNLLVSLDGKTLLPEFNLPLVRTSPKSKRFGAASVKQFVTDPDTGLLVRQQNMGQNISYIFTGAFNLTSALIDFTLGGDW